jgi:hypothetical protein
METNQDGSEVHETPEKAEETAQETQLSPEEIADLKKKAEASSQNFERLKKTEAELKELKAKLQDSSSHKEDALSPKDFLALNEAKVTSEDFDEVIRVSKILGKPISEALKDQTLKTILETRADERRTAAATQVRGGARGAAKVTGEDFLQKAEEKLQLPDSDEDMVKLAEARLARLKNSRK